MPVQIVDTNISDSVLEHQYVQVDLTLESKVAGISVQVKETQVTGKLISVLCIIDRISFVRTARPLEEVELVHNAKTNQIICRF